MHWPLTLLSRAIDYKNLTHAANNIGISQPQLSRIISKIEEEYSVVLLDRESKRKSAWTSEAQKLAQLYKGYSRNLKNSITNLLQDAFPKEITVGTLEGLIEVASSLCEVMLRETALEVINLDVYDLSELQNLFSKNELDLIFTSTLPGAKKMSRQVDLGYQTLDPVKQNKDLSVVSSYEFAMQKKKPKTTKVLVSNSLATRKHWLDDYNGSGVLPSKLIKGKADQGEPVYLLGHEQLNFKVWTYVTQHYTKHNN